MAKAGRDEKGRMLPGHTANPGGRPAAAKAFRDAALVALREGTEEEGKLLIDAWVDEVRRRGEDWAKASELLAAYCFGRPMQAVELAGLEGAPIEVNHQVHHEAPEPKAAARILVRLAHAGALPVGAEGSRKARDAEDDEVHHPEADRAAGSLPSRRRS